ncbi:hypothetical protein DAEQUDRAFT_583027 [Daedalea quercina L-15889]|uniref:Uncharacterized protein n=1 Tax=Daedalea quercina L-15889 TaxID=1314783 RepID=A0A165LRR8_9APHY|nr:hypothetical protein DAEQUDRAFT_583027 [Daedalea quercina L-15889]
MIHWHNLGEVVRIGDRKQPTAINSVDSLRKEANMRQRLRNVLTTETAKIPTEFDRHRAITHHWVQPSRRNSLAPVALFWNGLLRSRGHFFTEDDVWVRLKNPGLKPLTAAACRGRPPPLKRVVESTATRRAQDPRRAQVHLLHSPSRMQLSVLAVTRTRGFRRSTRSFGPVKKASRDCLAVAVRYLATYRCPSFCSRSRRIGDGDSQ